MRVKDTIERRIYTRLYFFGALNNVLRQVSESDIGDAVECGSAVGKRRSGTTDEIGPRSGHTKAGTSRLSWSHLRYVRFIAFAAF